MTERSHYHLSQGRINPFSQAILNEVQNKFDTAEKKMSEGALSMSNEEVRYWLARRNTLKEILDLPDKSKNYLDSLKT